MFREEGDCSGRACDWGFEGDGIGCNSGQGSCFHAFLLEADTSNFHDETLQKATKEIKEILDAIPPDPKGRHLCFMNTRQGALLGWVNHGDGFSSSATTIKDDFETISKALNLKG